MISTSICKKSFLTLVQQGYTIVDTRSLVLFNMGFVKGSIYVGFDELFIHRMNLFVKHTEKIVVIAEQQHALAIMQQLHNAAYTQTKGYLLATKLQQQLCKDGCGCANIIELDFIDSCLPSEVENYSKIPGIVLVDVRSGSAYKNNKLMNSIWIPIEQLPARIKMFDAAKTYLLYCTNGFNSAIAASVLIAHGINKVIQVDEGMVGLEKIKSPVLMRIAS